MGGYSVGTLGVAKTIRYGLNAVCRVAVGVVILFVAVEDSGGVGGVGAWIAQVDVEVTIAEVLEGKAAFGVVGDFNDQVSAIFFIGEFAVGAAPFVAR